METSPGVEKFSQYRPYRNILMYNRSLKRIMAIGIILMAFNNFYWSYILIWKLRQALKNSQNRPYRNFDSQFILVSVLEKVISSSSSGSSSG